MPGGRVLDGREREWWAKGEAHVLRLAGTLTYLNWAMHDSPLVTPDVKDRFQEILTKAAEPAEIIAETMQAAVTMWKEYFWPHARAALRQVGLSDRHKHTRRVLKWLQAQRPTVVSREDIRRDALQQQLDAEVTNSLLEFLTRAGWLKPEDTRRAGRGRPRSRWLVNPKLLEA